MCRPLTVSCKRRLSPTLEVFDHLLTHRDLKIPCKEPGSAKCKQGEAELVDFQNPPTTCAGFEAGFKSSSPEAEAICLQTLEKYAQAVHRLNTDGEPTKRSWLSKWFMKG